jgi:formylglycine-generating enzyme required for sulfatase activity
VSADKGASPVGSLEPNDLGLFDMLGNVMEWCQEPKLHYRPSLGEVAVEDKEYLQDISDHSVRVLRGGSFAYLPWLVRSSVRFGNLPSNRDSYFGLRPARTFP